jgi:ribonuclease VapC
VGPDGKRLLATFLMEAEIAVVPFGDAHWKAAIDAHRRYGKGRHPAGLNFGDCLTYATAKLAGEPLLCTGRDFAKTDLLIA